MINNTDGLPSAWDLQQVADLDQSEAELKTVRAAREDFAAAWRCRVVELADPAVLRRALDQYETLQRQYPPGANIGYYFELAKAAGHDTDLTGQRNQVAAEANEHRELVQFFEDHLSVLPQQQHETLLSAPELEPYQHFLARLFAQARHRLDSAAQKVANRLETPAYTRWVDHGRDVLKAARRTVTLPDGSRSEQSLTEVSALLDDPSKDIRDEAAQVIDEIRGEVRPTACAELNAILDCRQAMDELRGFARPDAHRYLHDDITAKVADALVHAVDERWDIPHRFHQLEARLLGVPTLANHECSLPIGQVAENTYTWPESCRIVRETLSNLSTEFADLFEQFLDSRRFDVYPRPGKIGGAGTSPPRPTSVSHTFLNHRDTLWDCVTLGHETGHLIAFELIRTEENALNMGVSYCTVEVPATYCENAVLDQILTYLPDPSKRLAITMSSLGMAMTKVFRSVAHLRFEHNLHRAFRETKHLSADEIDELYLQHLTRYWGPAVTPSQGAKHGWVDQHLLRHPFESYTYPAAELITQAIRAQQGPGLTGQLRDFIATGISASPQQALARMGLDLTDTAFWTTALNHLDAQLTTAEELAGSVKPQTT